VDGRRAALRLSVENRKLVVDDERAAHVRWIFARFLEIGSCTELAREVAASAASGRRAATGSTRSTSTGC
jgi:hypothetical protein